MKSSWQVATAAEAFAAAQFARCGFNVSVQYGANQPEYDLIVDDLEHDPIRISVKGSKDGSWGLTQSYLKNADYYGAIDQWQAKHNPKTVFCFVQFKGVEIDALPRIYLAHVDEVAARLKETARGRGDTILYEDHLWSSRAQAAGTAEKIPDFWLFTQQRLEAIQRRLKMINV